eukprot:4022970-Alexandrium_andersonii.AAC.1
MEGDIVGTSVQDLVGYLGTLASDRPDLLRAETAQGVCMGRPPVPQENRRSKRPAHDWLPHSLGRPPRSYPSNSRSAQSHVQQRPQSDRASSR